MVGKFKVHKAKMLKDPAVRAEYERLRPEYEIARALIAARTRAGLSQEALAAKMETTQSAIARFEAGRSLPSMRTLVRYAEATGASVHVELRPIFVEDPRPGKARPKKRVSASAQ